MEDFKKHMEFMETRRGFLKKSALGFGSVALASLMGPSSLYGNELLGGGAQNLLGGSLGSTHFPAKAKRVIYLFQSGGPSQLETFDYKPELAKWHGKEIPPSVQGTQRNSGMVSSQSTFPLVKSIYDFKQYGQSGAW
ncbi:MAG TPA: sulfatase, partial [Arenibacter sp.]|nr:sulfatase [Arenibacter sp.]